MSAAFELIGVSRSFEHNRSLFSSARGEQIAAVRDVTLSAQRGEICGLIGESGCGKTTIANLLLLLLRPDAGKIWIDGQDATGLRGYRQTAPVRRHMQAVFQNSGSSLSPTMSIGRIVTEPLVNYGLPHKGEAERLLEAVGLPPQWSRRRPTQLSGGQRQRVSIARAMALKPKLLVLDEPTSSLDVVTARSILGLITSLAREQDAAVLLITHDIGLAQRHCAKISIMRAGSILETVSTLEDARHPYTRELLQARLAANYRTGGNP